MKNFNNYHKDNEIQVDQEIKTHEDSIFRQIDRKLFPKSVALAALEVRLAVEAREEMQNGLGNGYSVPKEDMEEFSRELFKVKIDKQGS